MSVPQTGFIPQWTLGDRLRKARESAGLKQSELAGLIGISRASIVNYEAGRFVPSRPVLLSWALCCGVDYVWLSGNPQHADLARRRSEGFNLTTNLTRPSLVRVA